MDNRVKSGLRTLVASLALALPLSCSNTNQSTYNEVKKVNLETLDQGERTSLVEFHKHPYSAEFVEYAQEILHTKRIDFTDQEAIYVKREFEKNKGTLKDISPILP